MRDRARVAARRGWACTVAIAVAQCCAAQSLAATGDITVPETQAPEVEVIGHFATELGTTDAASQGSVTSRSIQDRPILRPGDILQFVPGMVVTQHSGDG